MNNYIAVGLPKCASTFMQEYVFTLITKEKNLVYFDVGKLLDYFELSRNQFKHHHKDHILQDVKKKFALRGCFIAYEGLLGNPLNFKKNRDLNYKIFGKNNIIIIVLRKPKTFINSLYSQKSYNELYFVDSKNFLSNKKNKLYPNLNWSLEKFSYRKLINLYKHKFKKVIVIKYENLAEDILKNLVSNKNIKIKKKINFAKKKYFINKGLNKNQISFLKLVNKLTLFVSLGILNLRSLKKFSYFLKYKFSNKKIKKYAHVFDLSFIVRKLFKGNDSKKIKLFFDKKQNQIIKKLEIEYKNL